MSPEGLNNLESADVKQFQLSDIRESFSDNESLKEFEDFFNTLQDKKLKDIFLETFKNAQDNENLSEYLDPTFGEGFPTDLSSLNFFIDKFKAEDKIEIAEDKIEIAEDKIEIAEDKIEIAEDKIEIVEDKIETAEDKIEENNVLDEEIIKKIDKIESKYPDFFKKNQTNEEKLKIIEENYTELLGQAQGNDSDYVELYDTLIDLQSKGLVSNVDFTVDQVNEYTAAKLRLDPKSFVGEKSWERINLGIDKSSTHLISINGDILTYGDQVIDMGKKPPTKSIKLKDYELYSGNIDYRPSKEFVSKRKELVTSTNKNNSKIDALNTSIQTNIQGGRELYQMDLSNKENRAQIQDTFMGNPKIKNALEQLEREEDSSEADALLTDGNTQIDPQKISKKWKDILIPIIDAQIKEDTKIMNDVSMVNDGLFKELNILDQKEEEKKLVFLNHIKQQDDKVRESLQFISAIGFDNIPQSISSNIFSQVSKTSPIYLGSNVITSIDLSTFSLEGSFRPTLNLDQGVGDMNTKRLFMQLMNKMITGDETYPIDIDSYVGGTPQYKANKDDTSGTLGNNMLQTYISDKIGLNGTTPDLNIKENIGWMGDKIKNK